MHEEEKKLADVDPEQTFKTHTGDEIKNLKQLMKTLNEISTESFSHHVNDDKNDFANWVRHSVKDEELADMLQNTDDFEQTKRNVSNRIELLEKNLEIKKIKENLDNLDSEGIDIDKIPDEITKPEESEETQEPQIESEPQEPVEAISPEEQTKESPEPEKKPGLAPEHPFEHLKRSLHLTIRDLLIGLVFGLILGYIIGAYF